MTARPRTLQITKRELVRLYVKAGLSVRDVAQALTVSKDTICRELERHGIPRRPRTTKRGRLSDIPVRLLKKNIKAEGLRGHARTLGMSAAALKKHIVKKGRC